MKNITKLLFPCFVIIILLLAVSSSRPHESFQSWKVGKVLQSSTPESSEDQMASLKANVQFSLTQQAKIMNEMLTLLQDDNKKVEKASQAYK